MHSLNETRIHVRNMQVCCSQFELLLLLGLSMCSKPPKKERAGPCEAAVPPSFYMGNTRLAMPCRTCTQENARRCTLGPSPSYPNLQTSTDYQNPQLLSSDRPPKKSTSLFFAKNYALPCALPACAGASCRHPVERHSKLERESATQLRRRDEL